MFNKRAAKRRSKLENRFCFLNFKKYLRETTLHGLRFVGDETITIWERGFFFFAIIAALIVTVHLIFYIYNKWQNTPIIIGVTPFPTSISEIPFPAITICNMNQLLKSKVSNYSKNSPEGALVDMACFSELPSNISIIPENYKLNHLSLPDFFAQNGQSCKSLLRSCVLNSEDLNCSYLFHDSVTDEGLCCVFNLLHPSFRFKRFYNFTAKNNTDTKRAVPVNWSPEFGYPKNLPKNYYPRPARGIGVSMGMTLVLDAEFDDYFCSSANGAGFKLALNSPIETPRVKQNGIIVGVGVESRYSIDANNYIAALNLRRLSYSSRKCLFSDEGDLMFYKYYTRLNCENECNSRYLYKECQCIPFNLPPIYSNATICGAPEHFCVSHAQNVWLRAGDSPCRRKCLNSCFDYTYMTTAYTAPLVQGDYRVQDDQILRNMSRKYIRDNILVLHFFFREFVFHGNTRNVYIGLTEFLSNVGGIMSLFLGFSFISLAEIFYYACMRPFFWWLKNRRIGSIYRTKNAAEAPNRIIWLDKELLHGQGETGRMKPKLWNKGSYRKFKIDLLKYQMKRSFGSNAAINPLCK